MTAWEVVQLICRGHAPAWRMGPDLFKCRPNENKTVSRPVGRVRKETARKSTSTKYHAHPRPGPEEI